MTKDTVKLAGLEFSSFAGDETGKDIVSDLGRQTRNGLSVRAMMTILMFVKAMAFFRGNREVAFEDLRQILPFVLHDKLVPDLDSPFFEQAGNGPLRADRIGWIRNLFDLSCQQYDKLAMDTDDTVGKFSAQFEAGLDGLSEADARKRLTAIEHTLAEWSRGKKLYGYLYDDLLKLKYLHQRYTNYLRWLTWKR
jgi:hypothetical protein